MSTDQVSIAGRVIGPAFPPYIIAELSANHNGDLGRALEIVRAAKEAGADAVKLQTYTPDTLTIDHDGEDFTIESGLWQGRTLYDLYREAHMPWDWHAPLFDEARRLGIAMFSSPFDESAIEYLEDLECPAYKIASFELVDIALIRKAASTGKPLIMSTGMANKDEIAEALDAARGAGAREIVLLHCISGYPTPYSDANLQTIVDMRQSFDTQIGLSDHTHGTAVSVAATALGASVIEKHFTLRRADGGPDSAFSLEPDELRTLVETCRTAHEALGTVSYAIKSSEKDNVVFRRSLYFVEDVPAGTVIDARHIRTIRPGYGLAPKHWGDVIGKTLTRGVARGTPVAWDLLE